MRFIEQMTNLTLLFTALDISLISEPLTPEKVRLFDSYASDKANMIVMQIYTRVGCLERQQVPAPVRQGRQGPVR